MKITALLTFILVIVGAINWLLVGLFQFDLVAFAFGGSAAIVSRIIYSIVGICGLYLTLYVIAYNPFKEKV